MGARNPGAPAPTGSREEHDYANLCLVRDASGGAVLPLVRSTHQWGGRRYGPTTGTASGRTGNEPPGRPRSATTTGLRATATTGLRPAAARLWATTTWTVPSRPVPAGCLPTALRICRRGHRGLLAGHPVDHLRLPGRLPGSDTCDHRHLPWQTGTEGGAAEGGQGSDLRVHRTHPVHHLLAADHLRHWRDIRIRMKEWTTGLT